MTSRSIAGFVLGRRIGHGGMGEVFEAWPQKGGDKVALKLLRDEASMARFQEELRLGQTFEHPHLVPVLDSGSDEGRPWFTMPLLRGATLAELRLLSPRGWPEGVAVAITVQALRALSYLHERGVVHRDVKPSNLFLCEDGTLRLIDFGIARWTASDITTTQQGKLVGSIRYASPEQAQGQKVGPRSDLFSLGLVLFELLSGERVFDQEESVAVITALLTGQMPALEDVRADVSPATVRLVQHLLKRSPKDRPASADEALLNAGRMERAWPAPDVAAWLKNVLRRRAPETLDRPAPSLVPSTLAHSPPPAARTRRLRTAALGAVALVLLTTGIVGVLRNRAPVTPVPEAPAPPAPPAPLADDPASRPAPIAAKKLPTRRTETHRGKAPSAPEAAWLTIDVRPGWAEVFIDGARKGETPLFRLPVTKGLHEIELVRKDGQRRTRRVTVEGGQTKQVIVSWPIP